MKPFLLISTRPDDDLAAEEFDAFRRFGGLQDGELVQIRLERESLPPFDPEEWSGVMLGGSPFDSSAPEESKSEVQLRVEAELGALLDQLIPLDFPFLGACYGVGTLAAHQGGTIDSTFAEDAGAVPISVTEEGASDPLLAGLPDEFRAFVGHHEACSALPANAVLLARGADCPVQMFRIGRNMYGTQFHPELDVPGFAARIARYKDAGYFDDYEAVRAAALLEDVAHSHRVITNFVRTHAR